MFGFHCSAVVIFISGCGDHRTKKDLVSTQNIKQSRLIITSSKALNIVNLSLLKDDIFIINNVIINPNKKTYGFAPNETSFYGELYKASEAHYYTDWQALNEQITPRVNASEEKVFEQMNAMENLGLTDIYLNEEKLTYLLQWGSSLMHGYRGLMFGAKESLINEYKAGEYDVFKSIEEDVFYFELR